MYNEETWFQHISNVSIVQSYYFDPAGTNGEFQCKSSVLLQYNGEDLKKPLIVQKVWIQVHYMCACTYYFCAETIIYNGEASMQSLPITSCRK